MIVWLDLFSCLVFLGSIPFITQHFRDRAEEVDAHNVTASDYSVWVWGVPDNVTQQQVYYLLSCLLRSTCYVLEFRVWRLGFTVYEG